MKKLFALRRELAAQVVETERKKVALDNSVRTAKDHAHDNITSPTGLLTAFASGAAAGWFLTRPKKEVTADKNGNRQSTDKSSSLMTDTLKNAVGMAASMVAANVTSQTMGLVKGAILEKNEPDLRSNQKDPTEEV